MRVTAPALIVACTVCALRLWGQSTVHVETPDRNGTAGLQEQTAHTAIDNYLHSWQSLRRAFEKNQAAGLDQDFVGTAKDKLAATIREQAALGLGTTYQDRSHDIKIVFYSPEGLSMELEDDVTYDVELLGHGTPTTRLNQRAKYFVVMTPAETRWRVRVFQAEHD